MTSNSLRLLRPIIEAMEERVLHSADLSPIQLAPQAIAVDGALQQTLSTETSDPFSYAREIVFIDSGVADAATLVADLQAQRSAGRQIEIIQIAADQDGVTLISEALAARSDMSAVHLIAHGGDGVIQLGVVLLDAQTLMRRAAELADWSVALRPGADLLLYGCDVAQSESGHQFVRDLATLTGADVAASSDITGAVSLGGNWALEVATGPIESGSAIGLTAQQQWLGTLAAALGNQSSGDSTTAVGSFNFAHAVNSGSDRLLLVELVIANGVNASAVSFNGNALSLLSSQNSPGNELRLEIWSLVAPPVISGSVNVTLDSASTLIAGATSYSGINQATPFGAIVKNVGSDSAPTAVVASTSGDLVVDLLGAKRVSANVIGANQTQSFVRNQGTGVTSLFGLSSREAGAAAVTMSHSFTSVNPNWATLAVELNQTGAAVNSAPINNLPPSAVVTQGSSLDFSSAGGNPISVSDGQAGSTPIRVDLTVDHGTLGLRQTIGPEFAVNTTTANDQMAPAIAVAADGHYVVVWQSDRQDGSKNGVYARVFNADGSARTGEILINNNKTDEQMLPSVAIDASGRFVVAWQSYDTNALSYDIYARSYNADGSTLSAEKRITTDAGDQVLASVALDAAGNVVIAYQSKGQDNADGKEGIYLRRANIALSTIVAEVRVNTTTLNAQTVPRVAAGDSGFVVVWQSSGQDGGGTGIYAQRYNTAGTKLGGEFLVNVTTAGDQSTPAVAMAADGRFAVTWASKGQDNADGKLGVYARRFAADGTASGSEFRVNTFTLGDQNEPTIAIAADGRLVVAWTSKAQDNADAKEGVYAQSYAADGTALGAEFRVNSTTIDVQSAATVGMAADGRIVAAWQSNLQDGNKYGVVGQRFIRPGAVTLLVGNGVADTAVSLLGSQADLNLVLDNLRYTPIPGYWGPATLNITSNDLGAGAGPALSTASALPIDVQKINVGPVNNVPGAQAIDEDASLVFSAANGNAISVADVDADPLPVQVTLAVTQGTLKLATLNGLTVVGGADGSASVAVQGRLADLNAALEGLRFDPTANFNGSATLTLTTNDLGHSTVGGPYSTVSNVAISIASINDAPIVNGPATLATVENTVLTLSTVNGNALSITDVDAGTSTIEVTLTSVNGTLKLGGIKNLSFVVGAGKGGETQITFRGTLANINIALNGLQFTPVADYAGEAFVQVAVNDLGNSGSGGAGVDRRLFTVDVTPDANNRAPALTVPPTQVTLEETPLVLSTAFGNAISLVDDAGQAPIRVTLTASGGTLTLGTSTGPEFQVNSLASGDQQAARVAMAPDGRQVAVWQSKDQDGSGWGIFLQRYSDDGFADGLEQRVNSTTAGDQTQPSVAVAADGSFVVVWTSNGQDGGGGGGNLGIYAQRYTADAQRIGGEFRVHSNLPDEQSAPNVAMDDAGRIVVVWQSKDQDGSGYGIYGQRFGIGGAALGGEFRINATVAGDQKAPAVAMGVGGAFVVTWQGPPARRRRRGR